MRDGYLNNASPALFRRVASSRVPLNEYCDIVLPHRISVKHDIVGFEIRVHDMTVVYMRKTAQSMHEDTLSHGASGKGKHFLTATSNWRDLTSPPITFVTRQMVSVTILSGVYEVSKKPRAVVSLDASG